MRKVSYNSSIQLIIISIKVSHFDDFNKKNVSKKFVEYFITLFENDKKLQYQI